MKKEVIFDPEKQIDFVKLVEELNWDEEIGPVSLVKAVNKVSGLSGRHKYETNEASYGALIKSFEKRVGQFVHTRFHGKDRFYSIKPEYKREQIIHFVMTGETKTKEIKEELTKKDSKFYIPEYPMTEEVKLKKSFPDDEALAKTVIFLWLALKNGGKFLTTDYNKIRDEFGWKRQRCIEGKVCSSSKEVNKVTSWLDLQEGDMFNCGTRTAELSTPKTLEELRKRINEVMSLIDDNTLKGKLQELTKVEEKPIAIEPPKPIEEAPKIVKASPEIGKSEFKEVGSVSSIIYEGTKMRWYKSLIASTFRGTERGVWCTFSDISQSIKKTRFVEISVKEVKEILTDVSKQFKGIFRSVDFGGVTVGSEVLIKEFINTYQPEKISQLVYIRLRMSKEEIKETYPELKIRIASGIKEDDNVYEVELDRSEKTEKAFAKLVFGMRSGEIILESPSSWIIKRTKILIDRLQNF